MPDRRGLSAAYENSTTAASDSGGRGEERRMRGKRRRRKTSAGTRILPKHDQCQRSTITRRAALPSGVVKQTEVEAGGNPPSREPGLEPRGIRAERPEPPVRGRGDDRGADDAARRGQGIVRIGADIQLVAIQERVVAVDAQAVLLALQQLPVAAALVRPAALLARAVASLRDAPDETRVRLRDECSHPRAVLTRGLTGGVHDEQLRPVRRHVRRMAPGRSGACFLRQRRGGVPVIARAPFI